VGRIYGFFGSWSETLSALWRSRRLVILVANGQGLVEYALLLVLVAVLVIGAIAFAGGRISTTLSAAGGALGSPSGSAVPTLVPTPTPSAKATATPKPTKTPKPTATPKPTKPPK
jgi:Flp pilus assembly pilin Flp